MNQVKPSIWCPGLNPGHSLVNGLVLALPFFEGGGKTAVDVTAGHHSASEYNAGAPISWKVSKYGHSLNTSGAANECMSGTQVISGATEATVMAFGQLNSPGNYDAWMQSNLSYSNCYSIQRWGGATHRFYIGSVYTTATVSSEVDHVVLLTYKASTYVKAWVDGIYKSQNVVAVPASIPVHTHYRVGDEAYPFHGSIYMAAIWKRALNANEIAELYADPWGMFRQRERSYFWIGASAAAGVMLTPDPAVLTLVAPAPQIEIQLNPTPAAMPIVAPEPTIEITLNPDAVAIPLIAPAPTILLTLNPDPAVVTLVAPDPSLLIQLNPDPAVITFVAPNISIGSGEEIVLTPDPAVIELIAPVVVITGLKHYNLYRGTPDLENVDYSNVIEITNTGETTITIVGAGHLAETEYHYVLRPVLSSLESFDISCNCEFVTDGSGDWLGNRPAAVVSAEGEVLDAGVIRLLWYYRMGIGGVKPDDFAVWYGDNPLTLGSGSPDEVITYAGPASGRAAPKSYYKDFTLTDGRSYHFLIVARTGSIESESLIVGPYLADSVAPEDTTLYAESAFV